jgi:hypothetical protein
MVMASMVYCEQVGMCRQLLGVRGEITHWYIFTKKIKG